MRMGELKRMESGEIRLIVSDYKMDINTGIKDIFINI